MPIMIFFPEIWFREKVDILLCLALFCNILIYICFANGNYQAPQYTTYHDLAYFETLTTQVKSLGGFTPEIIEFRDSGYLSEMDEVKTMPCYPEDGSIAIVGDTVVI